jgi:hypothetical protein
LATRLEDAEQTGVADDESSSEDDKVSITAGASADAEDEVDNEDIEEEEDTSPRLKAIHPVELTPGTELMKTVKGIQS